MNNGFAKAIAQKIMDYDTVMLFRHIRMDGDCVGATKGFREILRLTYPEKKVLIIDDQKSEYLAFLSEDDPAVDDDVYRHALGIVIDTADRERISNQKYMLCKELVKIDHHIESDAYGSLSWVEDWRPSACEMIAALYEANRDIWKIDQNAATYIYLGMVTDTGRFRFGGVNGETMRLAGMLLDQGIDTETLYAQLYLKDYESLKFRAYVYEHMARTPNGAAYIYVDLKMQQDFGLSFEAACNVISYLEGIRDCLCWIAFIESDQAEDGIRVRLRSRFMTINHLAQRHHGGGHACASGATVYSREEADQLVREADQAVKEYKEQHTGWM